MMPFNIPYFLSMVKMVTILAFHRLTQTPMKNTLEQQFSSSDFYAYRFMVRENSVNALLRSNSLLSQYVVDMFAKVEGEKGLLISEVINKN